MGNQKVLVMRTGAVGCEVALGKVNKKEQGTMISV